MQNEYGVELDRNGYAPSILNVKDSNCCHVCLRSTVAPQRHEVFHGSNRQKSKEYGLWIDVCYACHYRIHNSDGELDRFWKRSGQKIAMIHYNWSEDDWRKRFGKSYI